MASYDYDVIVIGSGAGGSIAAQQLAKAGKSVALVEKGKLGGIASRAGTIPLLAMRKSAEIFQAAKHGSRYGIRGVNVGYNYPSIKAWKDLVIERTGVKNSEQHFLDLGINVVKGRAYFIDSHTVSVGSARFSAREFLIATGSELSLPEVPGLVSSGFLTAQEAFSLNRPPKSLAIVGSGKTACEFAQLFASFGTKIYLIDSAPRLLPAEEPEVADILAERFTVDYSMSLVLDANLEAIRTVGPNKRVSVSQGGKSQTFLVDEILVASQKKAALDIGLENAGVLYKDGAITVSPTLQTSAKHIFAAGSCTGQHGLNTHIAAYQSQVAAYNLRHQKPIFTDYRSIPQTIATRPEIARVGPTEQSLKEAKTSFKTTTIPISLLTQANIDDFSDGFFKLHASSKTGALLGGTVVCPNATEVIHELAVAVQNYLSAAQLAQTIHVLPSWSEGLKVAAAKLAKL